MSKVYNYLAVLLCATVLYSCGNDESVASDEAPRDAIAFSATTKTSSAVQPFAAADDFPNQGKIGVVAAYYKANDIDWTSYSDINNAAAKAISNDNGNYVFAWDAVKYWPFDDSQLVFIAYSPVAKASGAVVLTDNNTALNLVLENNMPDVLYASANETPVAYSKTMAKPVELGEFKHALSQLTINIKADAISDVDLVSLEISTKKKNAKLNLLTGDNGLTIGDDENFIHKPVSSSQNIIDKALEKTVLLYPGTEDVTTINFTLKEKGGLRTEYQLSYLISFFENIANPSKPITLERAKNTTLNIKIKGKPVTAPAFLLEGAILDWIPMGDFGIIIK